MKTYYYLLDYCEEVMPCAPTLEAWAEWLSEPDEDWHRQTPAEDGDAFACAAFDVTYHKATLDGSSWSFSPPLPEAYGSAVPSYGEDSGWNADLMCGDLSDLLATLDDAESVEEWVAVLIDHSHPYTVTFRTDPVRCELASAGGAA
jgi:hypothetical protein